MNTSYKYIDLTYLDSVAEGNNEIMVELIEIFLDQIPEFTEGMSRSFEEKNWKTLASLTHKAKSSVLSMGMTELGEVDLKNLELMAKQQYADWLKNQNLPEKEEEIQKINNNLKNYYPDRYQWIAENNTPETIQDLIKNFILQCENATSELNSVLQKLKSL